MPKISVIMGTYNVGERSILEKAINSILQQSYSDFDFIICDDGSSDNTLEYLKEIKKNDNRIKLLTNKKNHGLAYTLNKCIDYSNCSYIARMDADDICDKNRLKKQMEIIENNKEYAVVGSNSTIINEKDEKIGVRRFPEIITKQDFLFNSPVSHPTVIMRKDALLNVGKYRDEKETLRVEDYDLWMRLFEKGYKIYNIQEELYSFREDDKCLKRRKYKYRINEMKIRYRGYKKLKLFPKGYLYIFKPIIVGIIPYKLLKKLRNKLRKENVF